MMKEIIWEDIRNFDLESPVSIYGFSTRLARENFWTINFTRGAILEYKKFMYLAATTDQMVSPSAIVDVVWHQHLIFTKSYSAFCEVLGKRIEHIPSTHQKDDFDKFKFAAEQTKDAYQAAFGDQPLQFWRYSDMYGGLGLEKSGLSYQMVLALGLLFFLSTVWLLYPYVTPFYVHIGNPDFIIFYLLLCLCAFSGLYMYTKKAFSDFFLKWNEHTFILDLTPSELIYMKSGSLNEVIHGIVDRLVRNNKVAVVAKRNELSVTDLSGVGDTAEYTVMAMIMDSGKIGYSRLLRELQSKPAFQGIAYALDLFKTRFFRSIFFVRLFAVNFLTLGLVFFSGVIRLETGLERGRPVAIILGALLFFLLLISTYLYGMFRVLTVRLIPDFYRKYIIPADADKENVDWRYFLAGVPILSASIIYLMNRDRAEQRDNGSCGGGGSSCNADSGSSCGGHGDSSCSSCGGCGGGSD